uniref:C-CAP/cofactor C-like domain-containing protein n=1 Tax=Ditylenchus dipsaci TaxID=166011 RepID=A0A915D570_9BILA
MSANSTATTLSSTLESSSGTPQPSNISNTISESTPNNRRFPNANGNTNVTSYKNFEEGGLYTFEEFIKAPGSASARSIALADNGEVIITTSNKEAEWKKVVDEFSASLDESNRCWDHKADQDDGFFNIALDSAQLNRSHKVPEDPLIEDKNTSSKLRFSLSRPATAKRSALYVVDTLIQRIQTFCPTVSARSNSSMTSSSYGGTGGGAQAATASSVASTYAYEQSNSSSLYGNQLPPDEPRTVPADALLTSQNQHYSQCYGHPASNRRSVISSSFGEDGVVLGIHPNQHTNQQLTNRQQHRNSTEDDMAVYTAAETTGPPLSNGQCNGNRRDAQRRRDDHYRVGNGASSSEGVVNYAQPEKYSWDVERPDPKNFTFADAADEVLIKNPGQVNGQQFAIENCIDSILIVLDYSSTVIIDDCKNCIIMLGPCKGSVFMRDCSNCVIYAICQQIQSCGVFAPWLSYENLEKHMSSSGLSPFTNQWSKVHNFTPESAKFTITTMHSSATVPSHVVKKQLKAYEERSLLLLYYESRQLIKDIFRHANQALNTPSRTATLRLLDIKDIDLRPGELETVLQLKFNSKSCGGKLVVIELAGADARHLCSQTIGTASKIGHYQMVEVISEASTEFYRTQLYRLSEIQCSV